MSLEGKVVVVTGGSRGIGLSIVQKLHAIKAKVVLLGSESSIPSSFYDDSQLDTNLVTHAICDLRSTDSIKDAVSQIYKEHGAIDAIIHNAAVINLASSLDVNSDKFDLMIDINAKAIWEIVKQSFEYLNESDVKQIIGICPPINLDPNWLGAHLPYTASRYLAGMLFSGMSTENPSLRINTLWPKTTIDAPDTCNVINGTYEDTSKYHRSSDIMADACITLLSENAFGQTGENFIDEEVLRSLGRTNFDEYELITEEEKPARRELESEHEEDCFNKQNLKVV